MKRMKLLMLSITAMLMIFSLSSVQAQSIVWTSQFFNNTNLSGSPVITRQDSSVQFNWGGGSPASGVNADNFSARFTTNAYFANASYHFQVVADDGVRLIIDGTNVILNTFDNPQPSQTLATDITLSAGYHSVLVDFKEVSGDAFIYVGWIPSGSNVATAVPTQSPSIPPTNGAWTAEYFANNSLSGSPSLIQGENNPSHVWGAGSPSSVIPADNFSARWRSNIALNGTYEITVRADDGVRIFVDGVLVLNEWHSASNQIYKKQFTASNGTHAFVIEYYEASGDAFLEYSLSQVTGTTPPTTGTPLGTWLAQYYTNSSLSGAPILTQGEASITRNWGTGSPATNVPADNFSVRWTGIQALNGGAYTITVRSDDGVRVYVNGVLMINEWHANNGDNTYAVNLNLSTGNHTIIIEYFELTGQAFIEYNLAPGYVAPTPVPPVYNSSAYVVVTTARLNVRQEPNAFAPILTRISQGQTYSMVGRNSDSTWVQINVNGTIGWVNATYTYENNLQGVAVTYTGSNTTPPVTGDTVITSANVNMRSGAGLNFSVLRIVPRNSTISLIARNGNASWYMVNYNGSVGWISASFARLGNNVNINNIPVR